MESLIVIILGVAFYRLIVETKWLTVRLPFGRVALEYDASKQERGEIDISGILMMGIAMVSVVVGFIADSGMFWKMRQYTEVDYEEDMARLWELYGRKQPPKVGNLI